MMICNVTVACIIILIFQSTEQAIGITTPSTVQETKGAETTTAKTVRPSVNVESGQILAIKEGQPLKLTCTAVGAIPVVPTDGYTWLKDGQPINGSTLKEYEVPNTKKTHKGRYTCTADNGLGKETSSNNVTVNIRYPPVVSTNSMYRVVERTHLSLTCDATAYPNTISFRWTGPGNLNISKQVLSILNIDREKKGKYICTATNTEGSTSRQTIVDVLYKPTVTITPNTTQQIPETHTLTLNCTVDSNPLPTSTVWITTNGSFITKNKLVIHDIKSHQAGKYTCKATNSLKPTDGVEILLSDNKTVDVSVLYLDRVDLITNTATVREGHELNVTCSTDSIPQAYIHLSTPDRVLPNATTNKIIHAQRATCLDTGLYTCLAHNSKIPQENATKKSSKFIKVQCLPREDTRMNITKTITAVETAEIRLKAYIIAYPAPAFIWYYNSYDGKVKHIDKNANFKISTTIITNRTFASTLTFNLTYDLYGDYTLDVYNTIGSNKLVFSVINRENPDDSTGIIVGTVVAVLLVGVGAAAVVFIVVRKRRKPNEQVANPESSKYDDLELDSTSPPTVYVNLRVASTSSANPNNDDNKIYANLNNDVNDAIYSNDKTERNPADGGNQNIYANIGKNDDSIYANV